MKIDILGCSGGIGQGLKTTTFLVDDSLLVDAGTGIELLTMDRMLAIRDVVITHAPYRPYYRPSVNAGDDL